MKKSPNPYQARAVNREKTSLKRTFPEFEEEFEVVVFDAIR
jgi:hypothetical protein